MRFVKLSVCILGPQEWDNCMAKYKDNRPIRQPGEPIHQLGGVKLDVPVIEVADDYLMVPKHE